MPTNSNSTPSIALYAYFGNILLSNDDTPGHNLYQLGLLDSISIKYKIDNFDFVNYISLSNGYNYPHQVKVIYEFPNDRYGELFLKYYNKLIITYDEYELSDIFDKIEQHVYSKIILKARFRNISTLSKKLKDTLIFEKIITKAINCGYSKSDIIVLDTDMSISPRSYAILRELVTIEVPSITIPGISDRFLDECIEISSNRIDEFNRTNTIFYNGNIDTSNYKAGNSKNPILQTALDSIKSHKTFNNIAFNLAYTVKNELYKKLELPNNDSTKTYIISRANRLAIWEMYKTALCVLNITKDKYLTIGFIPARVYESIIFGTVVVSYKIGLTKATTFSTIDDLLEICTYLSEIDSSDYLKLLNMQASELREVHSFINNKNDVK